MAARGRGDAATRQFADIQKAFELFDLNNDGWITMREFVKVMTFSGANCKPISEEHAIQLFKEFLMDADTDDDGKVSLTELAAAWGVGSASAAVAAAETIGRADFGTILNEDEAKQLVALWAPADTGLMRNEPPAPYFIKLLKQEHATTWHLIGEAEGPELKDGERHVAVGKEPASDEITLEQFQAAVQPRLAALNHYQTRTTPLGYEGDMVIWQYDRYNRDGQQFESGYLLGATVDARLVELWQWTREWAKTDAQAGGPKARLAPAHATAQKPAIKDFLGFTWFNDWVL